MDDGDEPHTRGRKKRALKAAEDEEPEPCAELASRGRKKRASRPAVDDGDEPHTRGRKRRVSKAAEREVEEPRPRARRTVKPAYTAEPRVARKRDPTPKASPKAKRAPKTPIPAKSKPAAKAKSKETSATSRGSLDSDEKTKLYKAKLSRKSAAYHRALKLARSEGKDEDLCRDLAREATS